MVSRLADLIEEMCPDGVKYCRLGDVATLERGTSITKKDVVPGDVPVVAGGRKPAYFHNTGNRDGKTIVVAGSGAYAGYVSWWEQPIFVSDAFSIKTDERELGMRYCFHWLASIQDILHRSKRGGGVPHVYPRDVAKLKIPVPPLEIQREIVKVLDAFTSLEQNLVTELELRKKQFQEYLSTVLRKPHPGWKSADLGVIGPVKMCKRIMKHQTTPVGEVPFFKIGSFGGKPDAYIPNDLFEKYRSEYPFPKVGDVLISAAGTIGRTVKYDGQPAYFQDSNIVWIDNDETEVINDYLYYWYQVVNWDTDSGTIKRLYNRNLLATAISYPSKSVQAQIVVQFDTFTSLIESIEKEITLRRKQYDYYRDQLLAFTPKES